MAMDDDDGRGSSATACTDQEEEVALAEALAGGKRKSPTRPRPPGRVVLAVKPSDDEGSAADDCFPDLGAPKELRRNELAACAHLSSTVHLRQALISGRSQKVLGATARAAQSVGLTPLETACQAGRLANARLLLKEPKQSGALGTNCGRPDLTVALAVDSGAADVVRLLLLSRAAPNATSSRSRPPLIAAVQDGRFEIVKALCESPDLDVDAVTQTGSSALHEAVHRSSTEMVSELLARHANPAPVNKRGWTPLHIAAHHGKVEILGQLLCAKAPMDGGEIMSPLAAVPVPRPPEKAAPPGRTGTGSRGNGGGSRCSTGNRGGMGHDTPDRKLSVMPASIPKYPTGPAGWAPLHLLLVRGDENAVKQAIAWNADPCRPCGPDLLTPLCLAISLGQEAIAAQLLALGPVQETIDVQDQRGRCALHFAVWASAEPMVRALLEVHAMPNLRTQNGLTPIDMARNSGFAESSDVVKRLLIEEAVRLVMLRSRCRAQNKYEESEMIRSDLRLRGVSLDVQNERWSLPDGTWGFLSAERCKAQAQGGPGFLEP